MGECDIRHLLFRRHNHARGTFMGDSQMEYQGEMCDVCTYTNAKKAALWGFSSSLTATPSRQTELYASFNYTYGRILGGEKNSRSTTYRQSTDV